MWEKRDTVRQYADDNEMWRRKYAISTPDN